MSVLISALAGGWYDAISEAVERGRLQLVASEELLAEFSEVAGRDRLRRWFSEWEAAEVGHLLRERARLLSPHQEVTACRDPNDNYLLALAEASTADYLVTRDEDLLVLERWKDTEIIPPSRFLTLLAQ